MNIFPASSVAARTL